MKSFRRVLIVEPYGIGDLLFLTPVLRALRLLPSVEQVDLVLGSRTAEMIRSNPHVDELYVIDKDLFHRQGKFKTFQDLAKLTRELRKKKYDLLLDYSQRPEYGFWAQFFLKIPVRSGFGYKRRGIFLSHRVSIPEGFSEKHVVDYYCEVAEQVGIRVENRFLECYLQENDHAQAAKLLQETSSSPMRYAVVAPGGGESWGKDAHFKRWPVKYFAQWLNRIKTQTRLEAIVIVGSPGEKELVQELVTLLDFPAINLVGACSISVTAAILSKAKWMIGNDGGLVHMARALRIPTIALYGPVDPKVYGPYPESREALAVYKDHLECRPCYKKFRYRSDCSHRDCLQALSVDEVMAKISGTELLERIQAA